MRLTPERIRSIRKRMALGITKLHILNDESVINARKYMEELYRAIYENNYHPTLREQTIEDIEKLISTIYPDNN